MKQHEMELVLAVVANYMDMDLRAKVAREAPLAYNAWMQGDYAKSVHTSNVERDW